MKHYSLYLEFTVFNTKIPVSLCIILLLITPQPATCAHKEELPTRAIEDTAIPIKSTILSLVDGSFINANAIEVMQYFKHLVVGIRFGTHNGNKRKGRYHLRGDYYGTYALAQHEVTLINTHGANAIRSIPEWCELRPLLQQAKQDFLAIADRFRVLLSGAKEYLVSLMESSCKARKRDDSLLLCWARCCTAADENDLFDKQVGSFKLFEQFCIDLSNFFDDLTISCPRAYAKFKARDRARREKWERIKDVMQNNSVIAENNQGAFMNYLKKKHLDKLSLADIKPDRLKSLAKDWASSAA